VKIGCDEKLSAIFLKEMARRRINITESLPAPSISSLFFLSRQIETCKWLGYQELHRKVLEKFLNRKDAHLKH
jgi:hypothetical protein